MITTLLVTLSALAGSTTEDLEATTEASGRSELCSRPVFFSTKAVSTVELEEPSLAETTDMRIDVTISTTCNLGIERLALTIDGFQVNSISPGRTWSGEGSWTESFTLKGMPARVLAAGSHDIGVSITGEASMLSDVVKITHRTRLTHWRDLDDDKDPDIRLEGGHDCDDTDPERSSLLPDYDDGIDNDCDGTVDDDLDDGGQGDGLNDALEEDHGSDPTTSDTDGDGLEDALEWGPGETPRDTDGDGSPDLDDLDSDDDGVPDREEAGSWTDPVDTDGDGTPDYRDDDDDGDGLPTSQESDEDYDGDGLPDRLDPDSDNDGSLDGAEGTGDSDGDGVPDHHDAGSDWGSEVDPAEPETRGFGLGCATVDAPLTAGGLLLALGLLGLRRRRR